MNKLFSFLKTIRFSNLLMLVLVQWIISTYFVIDYQFFHFLLISSSTVLIALAAYLLNDIADIEIDKINNKLKIIQQSNKTFWFKIVLTLNFVGLFLGFWASYLSNVTYFLYFVLAVVLLSAYAYFFSKYKLLGNLIISFLIALAILLCFYVQTAHPFFQRMFYSTSEYSLWLYAAFAFMFNWLREIVKDLEDIEGDKVFGRWTLPILIGVRLSKIFLAFLLVFFALLFAIISIKSRVINLNFFYFFTYSLFTLIIAVVLMFAQQKKDFAKVSFYLKLLMLIGLLTPVFFM